MTRKKKEQELDHPDQALDSDIPGDEFDEETWNAMVENYEGDPDE